MATSQTEQTTLIVDVVDSKGKKSGTTQLPADVFDVQTNVPLIHQVVVAQLAAAQRGVRALTGGSQLGHDDLVDQRDVGLDVEHLGRKVGRAGLLARGVQDVDGQRRHGGLTLPSRQCARPRRRPWGRGRHP